jgi:hypothetical protein
MNRKTFSGSIFCFMLLFMYNSANGQDRIITVHNDTIECRIRSITQTRINYEQTGGNYTVGKFIDLSEVSEYRRGVTQQNADRPEAFRLPDSSGADVPASRHWQAGLRFGGTYRVASSKDAENSLVASGIPYADAKFFYSRLKSGVHAGGNIHYVFDGPVSSMNMAAGVKYKLSSFASDLTAMVPAGLDYYRYNVAISEKIYLNYVGFSYIQRQWLGQSRKFNLECEASIGYVHYRDEARLSEINMLATGGTVGSDLGVSFTFCPLNYLSVNAGANYFIAVFKQLTFNDGTNIQTVNLQKEMYENASSINYFMGIQFHF